MTVRACTDGWRANSRPAIFEDYRVSAPIMDGTPTCDVDIFSASRSGRRRRPKYTWNHRTASPRAGGSDSARDRRRRHWMQVLSASLAGAPSGCRRRSSFKEPISGERPTAQRRPLVTDCGRYRHMRYAGHRRERRRSNPRSPTQPSRTTGSATKAKLPIGRFARAPTIANAATRARDRFPDADVAYPNSSADGVLRRQRTAPLAPSARQPLVSAQVAGRRRERR